MTHRRLMSKTKQLASIAAAGASAIALSGGKAEAGIVYSNILNVTIGFSNPLTQAGTHTVAAHVFNSLANGPSFEFKAMSILDQRTSARGNQHFSTNSFTRSIQEFGADFVAAGDGLVCLPPAAGYTAGMGFANGFRAGARSWQTIKVSTNSNGSAHLHTSTNQPYTNGLPSFTDQYFLFRFQGATTTEYGWVEASMTVTDATGLSPSYGPNLTIIQYAFENNGAAINTGEMTDSTPEPSSIAETGLAALILGAEGLGRWRKARQAAASVPH